MYCASGVWHHVSCGVYPHYLPHGRKMQAEWVDKAQLGMSNADSLPTKEPRAETDHTPEKFVTASWLSWVKHDSFKSKHQDTMWITALTNCLLSRKMHTGNDPSGRVNERVNDWTDCPYQVQMICRSVGHNLLWVQQVPINKLSQPMEGLWGGRAIWFVQAINCRYTKKECLYSLFAIAPLFDSGHRLMLYFVQAMWVITFAGLLFLFWPNTE